MARRILRCQPWDKATADAAMRDLIAAYRSGDRKTARAKFKEIERAWECLESLTEYVGQKWNDADDFFDVR